MLRVVLISALLLVAGCSAASPTKAPAPAATVLPLAGLLPGVVAHFAAHPELGKPREYRDMPDWAEGRRQQVTTDRESYLLYLLGEEVVSVYRYDDKASMGRERIYNKEITPSPTPTQKPSSPSLPTYVVLDRAKLATGGVYGDILVESISRATPASERERVLRAIAEREGFTEGTMFRTREAYQANISASYLKQHPSALRDGLLGSLDKSGFRPAERLYP